MSFLDQLANRDVLPSGTYLLAQTADIDSLHEVVDQAHLIFFYLDGTQIIKEMDFFKQIAIEMLFSGQWGENWESLRNVLVTFFEYEAPDEQGFVLLFDHCETFAENEPDRFEICLDVFDIVVNRTAVAEKRILFVLKGSGEKVRGLTQHLQTLEIT